MPRYTQKRGGSKRSVRSSRLANYKKYKKKKEYLKVKSFLPAPKELTILIVNEFVKKIIEAVLG